MPFSCAYCGPHRSQILHSFYDPLWPAPLKTQVKFLPINYWIKQHNLWLDLFIWRTLHDLTRCVWIKGLFLLFHPLPLRHAGGFQSTLPFLFHFLKTCHFKGWGGGSWRPALNTPSATQERPHLSPHPMLPLGARRTFSTSVGLHSTREKAFNLVAPGMRWSISKIKRSMRATWRKRVRHSKGHTKGGNKQHCWIYRELRRHESHRPGALLSFLF